jgi:hypothetical protein
MPIIVAIILLTISAFSFAIALAAAAFMALIKLGQLIVWLVEKTAEE